ncbi:DNA polymerase epsilon subunit 4-like isoform X2 [Anopheles albimanus]|uniref:DNA polymerase epsilon subunit 4-like isoform X2 n=1 Tax=Anopheles albimanus TaxID=7167 RepID=UPI00163FFBBF|nr:DNA polymerase epsilon subunit 4-like isoform X2 [Anopheles albimanus]
MVFLFPKITLMAKKESSTSKNLMYVRKSNDYHSKMSIQQEVNDSTGTSSFGKSNVSCRNEYQSSHEADGQGENRLSLLPFTRIKQLMKVDCEISVISAEAIFVVTKATELFVQTLARDVYGNTLDSNKKNLSKTDIKKTIENSFSLNFVDGMMNF